MKRYNGYVDSVKAEFAERVFSSRKRVIKFIAICFVPFLYAFVCIWAFWDPIPKIGEAPMAIVSNDTQIDFIVGRTTADATAKIAAGEAYSYMKDGTETVIDDDTDWSDDNMPNGTILYTTAGTQIVKSTAMIHTKMSLIDNLVDAWKSGSVENISYNQDKDKFTIKVNESMSLTNVSFVNGDKAKDIAEQNEDGSWKVKNESKYWAQIQMPTRLSTDVIGFVDAGLQKLFDMPTGGGSQKTQSEFITDLQKNSMQFWSTYKHNFLFGQFMYIFNEFKSSLLVDMGPQVISQMISLIIQNGLNQAGSKFAFTAPEAVNEILEVAGGHGSAETIKVPFIVKSDGDKYKYVVRNQEMLDAIKTKHPDWKLPENSIEGKTQNNINTDWSTDGFLNIFSEQWNRLMTGNQGNMIANTLSLMLTTKINQELAGKGLGSVQITSDGIKKLLSTPGNVAGLLEQYGPLIPETDANFAISATGPISGLVSNYKTFITAAAPALQNKFNLINIFSANSKPSPDLTKDSGAYVLPLGSMLNPAKGTFNYNLKHDINALSHLILGKSVVNIQDDDPGLAGLFPDLGELLKTTIVGSQFNPYGIGLGEFFLCIGLWVGTLMQTFVYDRAKRVKKAKPWAWYLSKTTLMMITAWIQTTILMISVYALGWSVMGSAFGLMYLWMMLTATVFVIIQQALWFSTRDETVGKFLVILLLIINLSSGWGTFPTFMQAGIFNVLSYIAPYTYSMHGQGVIIYSIAVNGANLADTLYILQQLGILVIWAVVFMIIGLLASILRNRDMYYGTHKSKKLGAILIEEKLTEYVDPKTNKAIWKKLPKEEMEKIAKKVKNRYPEEGQFKWYKSWKKRQDSDKPLTASESDDEIMRRNN